MSDKRPEWMTNISATVDPEDYLFGRKIDKTFELCKKEKADQARKARTDLLAKDRLKLDEDPLLDLEKRREELKLEIISNPLKLKQLREILLERERNKLRNSSTQKERPKELNASNDRPSSSQLDTVSKSSDRRHRHESRHGMDEMHRRRHHGSGGGSEQRFVDRPSRDDERVSHSSYHRVTPYRSRDDRHHRSSSSPHRSRHRRSEHNDRPASKSRKRSRSRSPKRYR